MTENDDLNAWPSDQCYQNKTPEKFNIVEFYHKILWNSQQQPESTITKKGERRVTFSKDPPEIFEYVSEYSRPALFFNYQSIFKQRFSTMEDKYPIKQVLHSSYYNSYNPIPNDNYHSPLKMDEAAASSTTDLDPPPPYQETRSLKRRLSQQFKDEKPVVFIQKTLRKIKSTPKLISERRNSVISLHKKSSFS